MKEYLLLALAVILIPPLLVGIWSAVQRRKYPPPPEAVETAKLLMDRRWLPSGWAGMIFVFVYAGIYAARRYLPLPEGIKVALLAVPVLALGWFLLTFHREVRAGDELARRVHLDALTSAFGSFLGFAMGMWVMNELDPAPLRSTYEMSLGFLPIFYFVGLFAAKSRYMPVPRPNHENR